MIRDLVELTVNTLKSREHENVKEKAASIAEERILDLLLLPHRNIKKSEQSEDKNQSRSLEDALFKDEVDSHSASIPSSPTRKKFQKMLRNGELDDRYIDMDVSEQSIPVVEIFSNVGMEEMGINFKDMFSSLIPKNKKKRKVKVKDALKLTASEEAQRLVDMDRVVKNAIEKVEQSGIVFIDEIDKIAEKHKGHGPGVSREGVQRDLLPIVEGSTVTTKYGSVKTDHILFIASGSFHKCKPSDLIPEFQGRFPIRVELDSLGENEFYRILTEPQNALLLQYIALLKTENINLIFEDNAIKKVSKIAEDVNSRTENIGARRLHTLMEFMLENVLFDAPDIKEKKVVIDEKYVDEKLKDIIEDEDLSRYIL
mmetsp:Transcript_1625/g.1114  ORF Transcript_1625/g.1114 Transcript_1625/m.1114 type:complete len:370 (+) Transcript_1625:314-1423(+)